MVKIIALHNHVVELKEAETLFHSLLVALGTKHIVNGEACADLTKDVNIVEVEEPICIVDHHCLVVAEFNKTAHLLLEAGDVVVDVLLCKHFSHVGSAGWVTDHACAAAEKGDRSVACHLKSLHKAESHEVTYMKAVGCRVKADVENCLSVVDKLLDFIFVRDLSNESAGNKFVINCHFDVSFLVKNI